MDPSSLLYFNVALECVVKKIQDYDKRVQLNRKYPLRVTVDVH
jgi:hypothetical protein